MIEPMTDEEFFTLLALKLGPPRPLTRTIRDFNKAALHTSKIEIDYLCEFVSLAGVSGFYLKSERDVKDLHARYTAWYARNNP